MNKDQFKRLLIVLGVALGIVFVPWLIGNLMYNFMAELMDEPPHRADDSNFLEWAYGLFFLIFLAIGVAIIVYIYLQYVLPIIDYIKNGK